MQRLASCLIVVVIATMFLVPHSLQGEETQPEKSPEKSERALIQLAILLDTSGSMDGLINQARTQLWKIVNDLATAKQDGKVPELQVALYEYGKNSLPQSDGYLREIVPLTDDLDKLSEELFALKTNGGKEYCGQVIAEATKGLQWSKSDEALKLIFIAGNEAFTQGTVNYKEACKASIEKGITVNTIYCGPEETGVRTGWRDGAHLADGSFMNIDQNRQVAQIKTPFDKKLAELGGNVNKTYLFYGLASEQKTNRDRQLKADQSASKAAPAAGAARAAFKGRAQYRAKKDLLDGIKSGKVNLSDLKAEELPKELKGKNAEEQKAIVEKLQGDRDQIQKEIRELSKKRDEYIAEQRKSQAGDKDTLDEAILKTVRIQAGKKRFQFEK